ncbi:MAG: hypothetical protein N3A54_02205, partial [Patescibacteria group bacterium]|nr:hypothetical protein [Patescibacteria group bacterium]
IRDSPSSGGGTAGGGGGGYSGGGGTGGGGAAPAEGWSGGGIAPIVGGVAGALGGAAISKGRKLFNFIRGGIGKIYKGIGNNNVGKIASGFRKAPVGNFLYNVGQKIGSTKIGSKLGAVGKFLGSKGGKLVPFLAPGIYLASQMTGDKPLKEKLLRGGGGVAGMLLGQMGGRLLGGMAGSIIPFAGTAIGSTIGSILGGSAGAFIGESLGGKLYNALFGEKESAPPGSDRSPWKNERKINLGVPNRPSRTIESTPSQRIEGGKIKENSQLEKMKSVLGEKLAVEAAHLAATEGGMDKEGNLKTDSINKLSQAAGMFQFLPGVAVDTIRRMDDQDLKDKFQKYIDEFEKNKKLSSSSREEVAKLIASLDETQQSSIYKKYIEPLATAKGGYDKLTAEDLKSYGFSPAAEMSGSDENTVVYRKGTPAYDQNTFLDLDKDGNITKGEIRQYSEKIIKNREVAFNKFLRKNVEGGKAPTPQAPTDQPIQRQREAGTELASARPPATRESEGEAMRPAPVLVASRRVITPETNELARESSIRTETAQTSSSQQSTIINVDNRSTVTRQSSSSQRMEIATVRNTDTTIQKALEKSYFA